MSATVPCHPYDEKCGEGNGEPCRNHGGQIPAAPESPAGWLDPISSAGVLGEAAPAEEPAATVDRPSTVAATHRRGLLSGVPAFAARRWAVGR